MLHVARIMIQMPAEPLHLSLQEFFAVHPFLFFLREKTTGTILFQGRYKSPPPAGGKLARVGGINYDVSQGCRAGGGVTPDGV